MNYLTCCVDSTAELIDALLESADPCDSAELFAACNGVSEWAQSKGYGGLHEADSGGDLSLADDWSVTFNRSVYDGDRCYFIQWSGIEFIWTANGSGSGFGYGSRSFAT